MPAPTGAAASRAASSAAPDAAKLGQRAQHHAGQGLNEGQVNRELMREGYTLEQIAAHKNKPDEDQAPKPAPSAPPTPAAKPARSSSSSPAMKLPGGGSTAGVLLALFGYPLALAYLTGGSAGLKKWFRAKFLNQTSTDPGVRAELFSYPGGGTSGGGTATAAYITPKAPKPTKVTSPVGNTAGVAGVIAFERAQLGEKYVYGANGPDTWDCSSLVQHAYASIGVKLPRVTELQILAGKAVHGGIANARPGDLIFPTPHHVQTYLGGGQILEAPHTGALVRVSTAPKHPIAIRRIL